MVMVLAEMIEAMNSLDPMAERRPDHERAQRAFERYVEQQQRALAHYVRPVEGGDLPDALSHGACNERHGQQLAIARARGARETYGPPAPPPAW